MPTNAALRPALRSPFLPDLRGPLAPGATTSMQRAIAFLRSLGTSAHVWLPGADGVSVASLPSNNYLLSDFATLAGVDAVVGGVKDALNPSGGVSLTQATTANKPLVRRGAYNRIAQSGDMTVSPWVTSTLTCTRSTGTAPGGTDSFKLAFTPADTASRILATPTFNFGVGTLSFWAKTFAGGTTTIRSQVGGTVEVKTITGTWTQFSVTGTTNGVAEVYPARNNAAGNSADVLIWHPQLEDGTTVSDYTPTTATAASNPSAGKYWWSFDGSNDSLLSGNLGITNACTIVIAGMVNSLSAALQVFLSEDTNGAAFYVNANGSVDFSKTGVAQVVATAANVIVAGVPFVITARLSSGTAVIRKNGVQVATAATGLTFSATTGARVGTSFNGTSNPLGGALGWVVPIAAALSDADCLTVERLVGQQFPGMATF